MTVKHYIPPFLCDDDNCTSGGGWHMVRIKELEDYVGTLLKEIEKLKDCLKVP